MCVFKSWGEQEIKNTDVEIMSVCVLISVIF